MSTSANLSRTLLLQRLADGQFHSGEVIGAELGLSRAAVSKHVKALTELGLDIFSVTGKGYKLSKPLSLLEHKAITRLLEQHDNIQLTVLNIIDSTNQYVKDLRPQPTSGYVCLAEAQTAGRGRQGRTWESPYGASIYMSMFWRFDGGYQAISGLSLVVGIAIAEALSELSLVDAKLKWPNDVYVQGKKLAGILVEVEGQLGGGCDCIIGLGLNVDLPEKQVNINQPWTDIIRASGKQVDRNILAAHLIKSLNNALTLFEQRGLVPFLSKWQSLDYFYDQPIKLLMGKNEVQGIGRGIDANGALLLESDGEIKHFHGGEISVRAN